jgi:hypothetical protein
MLGEVPGMIPISEFTPNPSEKRTAARSKTTLPLVIAIIIIVVLGFGAVEHSSSASVQYACISVDHQGTDLVVSTSGIIHVSGSDYYFSCSEGSPLPTSSLTVSCLTVSPQEVSSPYPGAASTYYYHLTTKTGTISLQGAPVNATEVIAPSSASVLVTC